MPNQQIQTEQNGEPCLKVAIIGYGLAGRVFHGPLIRACKGLEVTAIVTSNKERQLKAAKDFPQAKICSDLAEALSLSNLVVIASPNASHVHIASTALRRGLAVVVDKPMAISSPEAEELVELKNKTGGFLSVFHNRRWDGDFLSVKELIDTGTLGQITKFESRFERFRPAPRAGSWRETFAAEEGGGILLDLGSHLVDQAIQLFGQPKTVYAELHRRREGVKSEDDDFLSLVFNNDIRAHLFMGMLASATGPRFRICGMKGAYEKYGLDPQENSLRSGASPLDSNFGEESEIARAKLITYTGENADQRQESTLTSVPGRYLTYYEELLSAITRGTKSPVSAEEGLAVMKVLDLARLSSKQGVVLNFS